MAKKKKSIKKKAPRKVSYSVTRKTTIGKATAKPTKRKGASYYIKAAKDRLYDEMARLFTQREKATKKSAKKKISKKITEKKRQINKLK